MLVTGVGKEDRKVDSLSEKSICCLFICSCVLQLLQFVLSSHYVCRISFLENVFATTIYLLKMIDPSKKHAH